MGFATVYKIYGLPLAERLPIVPPRVKDYQLSHGLLAPEKIIQPNSALKSFKYTTKASSGLKHQGSSVKAGL